MSEQMWPEVAQHPPLAVLTLYLEGELEGAEAGRTKQHLQDCWDCRRQLACLEQGIYAFVDYRREVLIPNLPPFSEPSGVLRRLRQEALRGTSPSLRQALSNGLRALVTSISRPAWISATVSVITIIALLQVVVLSPPRMQASEFLRRACASVPALERRPRTTLYQRIRIRRGDYVFDQAVSRGTQFTSSSLTDLPTKTVMQRAGMDDHDPLNPQRFSDWREAQINKQDKIFESQESLTLRTTTPDNRDVQYASLTVSRVDWRPVAEHIEFRNGPALDVMEISLELRELPPPEKVAATPAAASDPAVSEPELARTSQPVPPNDAQLDDAEVRLLEAFHQLGADVREVPSMQRGDHEIRTTAFADTAARRKEILAAIDDIPFVTSQISDPETVVQAGSTASSAPQLPRPGSSSSTSAHVIEPPLAQSLADYLGGLDRANEFLIDTRNAYLRTFVEAAALKRLADRYPDSAWNRLSSESRTRLDLVAADYIAPIRTGSREYLYVVEPILKTMSQRQNVFVTETLTSRPAPGCASWRTEAGPILDYLQTAQTSFRRLFIAYETDTQVTLSPDAMLRDSLDAQSSLKQRVNQLCQH